MKKGKISRFFALWNFSPFLFCSRRPQKLESLRYLVSIFGFFFTFIYSPTVPSDFAVNERIKRPAKRLLHTKDISFWLVSKSLVASYAGDSSLVSALRKNFPNKIREKVLLSRLLNDLQARRILQKTVTNFGKKLHWWGFDGWKALQRGDYYLFTYSRKRKCKWMKI